MKLFFAAVVLLCVSVQFGFSLECYECQSEKNCNDNKKTCTVENPVCMKFDGTKDGKNNVVKRCVNSLMSKSVNKCTDNTFEGATGTLCMCSTDLCNDSNVIGRSGLVAFSLVFFSFLINYAI